MSAMGTVLAAPEDELALIIEGACEGGLAALVNHKLNQLTNFDNDIDAEERGLLLARLLHRGLLLSAQLEHPVELSRRASSAPDMPSAWRERG